MSEELTIRQLLVNLWVNAHRVEKQTLGDMDREVDKTHLAILKELEGMMPAEKESVDAFEPSCLTPAGKAQGDCQARADSYVCGYNDALAEMKDKLK